MKLIKYFSTPIVLLSLIAGCAKQTTETSVDPTFKTYCAEVKSYDSSLTVTGSATFQARISSTLGLGAPGAAQPIRNAEIRVVDTSNTVVQCSETDTNGNFSLTLPSGEDTYTVQITSRANNSKLAVSILNNPTDKLFHYISKSFSTSNSNINIGTINAPATGNIEGGAFNIMNQIWQANEFLRNQTDQCATYGCAQFTAAPPVTVYWSKGVNPGIYFGIGPISFYVPSQETLYILGGSSGNTSTADTDHFDNSIILHEYGHFIEHKYASTDSPGGSHNGNSVIDPRLAWGEGWANFFQAAVTGTPIYRDTSGNNDGTTQNLFNENLETPGNDIPSNIGEGNFREFSITRTFWDLIDPHPVSGQGTNGITDGSENATLNFSELWAVFTKTNNGFRSPNVHFRNAGYFYDFLLTLDNGANDINSALTAEKQRGSRQDYGALVTTGLCPSTDIFGVTENVSASQSNQFHNNDFYEISHNGGALTLSLEYTQANNNDLTDLDLYLYKEGYTYLNGSSYAGASDKFRNPGDGSPTESGVETISLNNLDAGTYMINIRIFKVGAGANYILKLNGSQICAN